MRGRRPRWKSKARASEKVGPASHWLGKRARELRVGLGLTQVEVAERAGLDPKHLQEIEVGLANPVLSTVLGIARGLSVAVSLLLAGIDQPYGNRLLPDDGTEASKKRRGEESDNVRFVPIPKIAKRAPGEKFPILSAVERDVFDLLVFEGLEDKEIAERLNIRERVARFHVLSVRKKFGARDRLGLVVSYWKARLAAREREEQRRRDAEPAELPQDGGAKPKRKR